jgi:hypothetical protein
MIMDEECDMCSYSACEHAESGIGSGSGLQELASMTALHAPSLALGPMQ